jgi:spore germination protein YaaH
MNNIRSILLTIVIVLIPFPLLAQQGTNWTNKLQSDSYKSIHRLEWETHRERKHPKRLRSLEPSQPAVDLIPKQTSLDKEVFGYLPYWMYNNYPNLNYDLLSTIAYFGVEVDGSGNIIEKHDWPATNLIDFAHRKGVRVVLTVILFNKDEITTLLSSTTNCANLINNLLSTVQSANADGVSIDFEGVPSDANQRNDLTAFMTKLSTAFHDTIPGSFVTIFTPAVDWGNVFDYDALAQVSDGLIMQGYDYHWSTAPTAGPVAPLTGDRWGDNNVTWTLDDYLNKTAYNTEKLILSVPFYGLEWITEDDQLESPTVGRAKSILYSAAYSNAQFYGRLWDTESQTAWYKYIDEEWHQGWYDDAVSLGLKFDLVNNTDLQGAAIWALGYDGRRQELQQAVADAFGSSVPPLPPTALRVRNTGCGVEVAVAPSDSATAYKIYHSTDGVHFDMGRIYSDPINILYKLSHKQIHYFKVSTVNSNEESNCSEVLAVKPDRYGAPVLIVNGFDRSGGVNNTFDYIRRFAPSVVMNGVSFDASSNEAIEEGAVDLRDYPVVIWICGKEGSALESFSRIEQIALADYLEEGGRLFVSGSEIGYDLAEKGNSADQDFYHDYLKAEYVGNQVTAHNADGVSGSIFNDLSDISFDGANDGAYNVDSPDGINPQNGALRCMTYDGFPADIYGGACIQFSGTFGTGTRSGRLVYLAFPFEAIQPAADRTKVMADVLDYFGADKSMDRLQ